MLFIGSELTELRNVYGPTDKMLFEQLKKTLTTNSWSANEDSRILLKKPLTRLCGRYLFIEKRRGYAYNPVGRSSFCNNNLHIIHFSKSVYNKKSLKFVVKPTCTM